MQNYDEAYIDSLVRFFEKGIKNESGTALGLEAEHFILYDETNEAVPYYGENGVREIAKRLMTHFPNAVPIIGEDYLGFETDAFSITLEPAAQLEISIVPAEGIACIGTVYQVFLRVLEEVLKPLSVHALAAGCQPVNRVRDLPLIPKERYRLMDRYFETTGTGGIEMMRGTCATQVSIDYFSEDDFRKKIQAAYYYTPVFKLFSDNSPVFEGRPSSCFLKRNDIWKRTDPKRCGVLPGIFKPDYGFADYARFLADMPLIFTEGENGDVYTGAMPSKEIYRDRIPTESEILHIISMAFPDVRLKRFLEIRAADSMPEKDILAYCALVKGLLYSDDGIGFAAEEIRTKGLCKEDIEASQDDLMKNGWDGKIYGHPARSFVSEIIALAKQGLPDLEKDYLEGRE